MTYSTSSENITIIAIQATSLLGHRTGGNVEDTGKKLSNDLKPSCNIDRALLLHIGNHQHQTLRAGEGSSKNSTNQGSMKSSHGSSLRLQGNCGKELIPASQPHGGADRRCFCVPERPRRQRALPWQKRE